MKTALTIAGSDSSAGAGMQADLKTFAAHGVYGTCAVTAVTAQSTAGIGAMLDVPAELVARQIDVVAADLTIHATKIGMLSSAAIARTVARSLARWSLPNIVLDPVMRATNGTMLATPDAVAVIRSDFLPVVTIVTPNAPEAAALAGVPVISLADAYRAAERILALGARAVVVTGGHLPTDQGAIVDVLADRSGTCELRGARVETRSTHGTGCTFAAAIAANLALGHSLRDSAERAKQYVTGALRHALALGHGHGPLDHFWKGQGGKGAGG